LAWGEGGASDWSNTGSATTLPTVTVSGAASVSEQSSYALTPTVNYDSNLPFPVTGWSVNWGDGVTDSLSGAGPFPHTYAEAGHYPVAATAQTAGGAVDASAAVTVSDPAAALALGSVDPVNAGDSFTMPLSLVNPGGDALLGWVMDWDDGTVDRGNGPSLPQLTHAYRTPGASYSVTLTLFTDDQALSASAVVTVAGTPPANRYPDGVSPQLDGSLAYEGGTADLVVGVCGTNHPSPFYYTIDWGDGSAVQREQATVPQGQGAIVQHTTHAYGEQGNYWVVVRGTSSDGTPDGSYYGHSLGVPDERQTPSVDAITDQTLAAGQPADVSASFSGLDDDGPMAAYVDWGDGTGPHPATITDASNGAGTATAHLDHSPAGDYSGTLTVYDEDGVSASSSFNLKVIGIKLEVVGVSESTKGTVGGLISVDDGFYANNHDASGNPVPDDQPDAAAGSRIVAADLNLADASLSVGAEGVSGTWQLTFPSKIKVWRAQPDGTFTPVVSGQASEEITQAETIPLKIEGMDYSDAPRDVQLSASFTADSPSNVGTLNDEVILTIPKMEFVTYDAQTGQESPVEDVTYASDPRPQVSLSVTDAHIDSNGYLSVTVQGEVTDQLSEIMPNAADRVQSLQFIVNGQVIDALSNLPSQASPDGASVWRPYPFDIHFQRTLTIDPALGSALVIRAQTAPNAAGNIGYHDVGVTLGSLDMSLYPAGHPSNPTGAGAYAVGDDGGDSTTIIPYVQSTTDLGGSPAGSFQPMMLRIDNLDDQLARQVQLTLNGVPQTIAPFDDSATTGGGGTPLAAPSQSTGYHGRYYMVFKDQTGQRRILVTTFAQGANPDLSQVKPDNISVSDGPNVRFTLMHNGKPMLGASTMEMPLQLGPETPTNLKGRKWDMPEMLTWFQALFGNEGLDMLSYFQAGGNTIKRTHYWRNKLWGIGDTTSAKLGGTFEIKLEEETDPVSAAMALYQALQYSLRYSAVRDQIPVDADHFQALKDTYQAAFDDRAALAATLAKAYLSGIVMANVGGTIAITLYDAGSGDYAAAAIDLIPLVAPFLLKGAKDFILLKVGGEQLRFDRTLVQAMLDVEAAGGTLAQRMAVLEQRVGGYQNLPLKMREALVQSDVLRGAVPTNRNLLAENLGAPPARFTNPQAHHDLPWTFKDWFAAHGIDVNQAQYGRWVEGTPPGGDPANWRFHQGWTPRFNSDWSAFIEAETAADRAGRLYTQAEILDKMASMRSAYPVGGISR
ncbi:MAG TPA: PKD domain-containing protein, partial [Tepidisphaeraceae bacterium]|nr:PKD domain-containing protein [Tepidisphaeraceae bacterium]